MATFDERVALLEEHLVESETTPEEHLARAEELLAAGLVDRAAFYLNLAKIETTLDNLEAMDRAREERAQDEWEDDDDV